MTSPTQSDPAISSTSSPALQLSALVRSAGLSRLDSLGWIRVTGEDRVRWLNGMVTNSIQALKTGEGNYNFLLSVQGRIQGDATIFARTDALLMETAAAQIPSLMTLLDRFIIMDDVELADVSDSRYGLLVAGPTAVSVLQQIGLIVDDVEPQAMRTISWGQGEVSVIHAHSPLLPRYELWADGAVAERLYAAISAAGATPCEHTSLDWLRMLEGAPLYGSDIRDRELAQETGQTRALHFAKGCYLGQEIVERIRSRGNVHRTFQGFRLDGALPTSGTILEADGKQVGELTSVAAIPLSEETGGPLQIGLGYIRREALDRGLPIVYPGGVALPISLPISTAAASGQRAASETSERV